MGKQEITVTCFYTDEGDAARQIIFRSFEIFLRREIALESRKLAFPAPGHASCP